VTAPVATVVITTWNRPHRVRAAVESALAQSLGAVEVIVVDDGSDPPVRLREDPRLRLVRLPANGGYCRARNEGLRLARGQWATFLDDDDLLEPGMLEVAIQAAEASTLPPPVASVCGVDVVGEDGSLRRRRLPRVSLLRGAGAYLASDLRDGIHATLVAPTAVLRSLGGFDPAVEGWEHTDLFLRLERVCSVQAVPLIGYRVIDHGGPRVHRDLRRRTDAVLGVVARHREVLGRHPRRLAEYLAVAGVSAARQGRLGLARRCFFEAVRAEPGRAVHWARLGLALVPPASARVWGGRAAPFARAGGPQGVGPVRSGT
jgi:glycosyltransferase involved in cell wall biosynthesis